MIDSSKQQTIATEAATREQMRYQRLYRRMLRQPRKALRQRRDGKPAGALTELVKNQFKLKEVYKADRCDLIENADDFGKY